MEISLGLAFLAGLSSFFSPCVFPLIPAYVSYFGGMRLRDKQNGAIQSSDRVLLNSFFFVAGFTLVFISMGAGLSYLSSLFYGLREVLGKIGGLVILIFGFHLTGIIIFPFLNYQLRFQPDDTKSSLLIQSFLMGVFFSAGWSPCIGPVLGSILSLSIVEGSVLYGIMLLAIYSFGLGLPFIICSAGINWLGGGLARFGKYSRKIEIVMGLILIITGLLVLTGLFQRISLGPGAIF